jgi:hypothetical protein
MQLATDTRFDLKNEIRTSSRVLHFIHSLLSPATAWREGGAKPRGGSMPPLQLQDPPPPPEFAPTPRGSKYDAELDALAAEVTDLVVQLQGDAGNKEQVRGQGLRRRVQHQSPSIHDANGGRWMGVSGRTRDPHPLDFLPGYGCAMPRTRWTEFRPHAAAAT